ncbi:MAG: PAAR domain-containing protein [Saprospiraceae bacterium]
MYVGKQFDIVLGVDIHIIQPPGPVPPVPVPHPFVGIVYDPMEFVPILGASISTNGIPRAQAGTTVKATPPHFPIGGVFVKPPSNDGEIYMGSISVPIEGEPFPYLGCPVLTCQDAGMMPVPRPMRKSKSKPKSMVLPTSVLLPIPKGGVNFSPTPPSISIAGLLVKIGLKFLGKIAKKLRSNKESGG